MPTGQALTEPSRAKIWSKRFPVQKHTWTLLYPLSLSPPNVSVISGKL